MRRVPMKLLHDRISLAQNPACQRGFLLITAVVLIVVAAVLLSTMVFLSSSGNESGSRNLDSKQALFIAGTGLERGIRALVSPDLTERVSCGAVTGDVNLTNVAFGDGQFTVTGGTPSYSSSVATLIAGITAADSIIPVADGGLTGYAGAGRVLIGRESIDYSGVETDDSSCGGIGRDCLVGAQRGRDGTSAVNHASGTPLGQYQCNLQSQGGVPDLINIRGTRILQESIQLQEGWAVGSNGTIVRWAAGPNGIPAWTTAASPTPNNLMSLSMLSYADGWAVGDKGGTAATRPRILYWNGTSWIDRNSNLNINRNLESIACMDSDNCWAVGEKELGILHWNGTAWHNNDAHGLAPNLANDMRSIFILSTTYGWTVGKKGQAYEYTGGVWQSRGSLSSNQDLEAVYCVDTANCWATGKKNRGIYHWDGASWHNSDAHSLATTAQDMRGLFMMADSGGNISGWAVGKSGQTYQYVAATGWTSVASGTGDELRSVHCIMATDCWASAKNGTLIHWNGSAWSAAASPTGNDLEKIYVIGAQLLPQAAWRELFQ